MSNKRGFDRLAAEGTVDLNVGGQTYRGWLQNICFSGFGSFSAVMQWKMATGVELEFNIGIPSLNETIEGRGVVRHVKETQKSGGKVVLLGIEFLDVNKGIVESVLKKLQDMHLKGRDRKRSGWSGMLFWACFGRRAPAKRSRPEKAGAGRLFMSSCRVNWPPLKKRMTP